MAIEKFSPEVSEILDQTNETAQESKTVEAMSDGEFSEEGALEVNLLENRPDSPESPELDQDTSNEAAEKTEVKL